MAGAVFQVWQGEDGEKKTYTSDEKGEIRIARLEPGIYQYQEIKAPEGYRKDSQIYTFTVGENGHPEDPSYETGHVVFNTPIRTEILKVDGCTGEALERGGSHAQGSFRKDHKNVDEYKGTADSGRPCSR